MNSSDEAPNLLYLTIELAGLERLSRLTCSVNIENSVGVDNGRTHASEIYEKKRSTIIYWYF